MLNKNPIKCPYCLSKNTTVIEDAEEVKHFHCLCSDCGKQFTGYIIDMKVEYEIPQPKECELGEVGRSSESYEEEINRLKHEKERLLLAIENLNKTINILMDQIIREDYRSND